MPDHPTRKRSAPPPLESMSLKPATCESHGRLYGEGQARKCAFQLAFVDGAYQLGGEESRSGPGSSMGATKDLRASRPTSWHSLQYKRVLKYLSRYGIRECSGGYLVKGTRVLISLWDSLMFGPPRSLVILEGREILEYPPRTFEAN